MKLTIEWTYKTPKGAMTVFRSEPMSVATCTDDCRRYGAYRTCEIDGNTR